MKNKKGFWGNLFAPKNAPKATPGKPVSKFAGVSQPAALPDVAEKNIEGGQLIISRLPAYDAAKDPLYNFRLEEKNIIRKVTRVVADQREFFMLTEDGERVYEIKYAEIDRILHRERAAPVHICRVGGDAYKDRIPFPTWTNKFHKEFIETIVERAGLEEKKSTQSFRDETVESSYYGRKS